MNIENEIRELKAANHLTTLLLAAALAQLELEGKLVVETITERFRLDLQEAVGSMGKGQPLHSGHRDAQRAVAGLYQPALERLTEYVTEAKRQSLEASK
jgi:hypothetical protein